MMTSSSLFFRVLKLMPAALIFLPALAWAQPFPEKPITIYCGYAAGASTDVTVRAIAEGAEKTLGVPVVVENKPGGGSTVAAGLIASKKPDGYTLGVVSTGALDLRPHVLKLPYDPLKDFTYLIQYSRYFGGMCVLGESPIKNIDQFITYAKAHPGLSYASSGMYSAHHLAIDQFARCKGLQFKHIPVKGGAEVTTMLLGKHLDFAAASSSHVPLFKQGTFRLLAIHSARKRDPGFPDVPTMGDLGCPDIPGDSFIVLGPKGIPDAVAKKLEEAFKKTIQSPSFRKVLENFGLVYEYKERKQAEKDIPVEYQRFAEIIKKMGVKQEK